MSEPKGLISYLQAVQEGDEDAEAQWQDLQNAQANDDYEDCDD